MSKFIFTSFIATSILFAYNAEVVKDAITIEINQENQNYKIGDKFILKGGDLVCFISGDGKILIKRGKYSKKISKRSKCKNLPIVKKEDKNYLALASSAISIKFGQAKEELVHGVNTRSVTTPQTDKRDITLSISTKYLILENKSWGPLPVSVQILDTTGQVMAEDVNEDEDLSSFVFPTSFIKTGYQVKVTNGFDEFMVDSSIHFQENKETK